MPLVSQNALPRASFTQEQGARGWETLDFRGGGAGPVGMLGWGGGPGGTGVGWGQGGLSRRGCHLLWCKPPALIHLQGTDGHGRARRIPRRLQSALLLCLPCSIRICLILLNLGQHFLLLRDECRYIRMSDTQAAGGVTGTRPSQDIRPRGWERWPLSGRPNTPLSRFPQLMVPNEQEVEAPSAIVIQPARTPPHGMLSTLGGFSKGKG